MVMVPQQVLKQPRLTFEDYQQLPDDQAYEIIGGRLYVAPRPRPRHQIIANRLAYVLTGAVDERGLGTVVPDADLILTGDDVYVSPDIMVFLREQARALPADGWIRTVPDLIVEVLSPSTEDYDRTTKRECYGGLGVAHYWMADAQSRSVTECVLGADGRYRERTIMAGEPFVPQLFPDLTIDLTKLFQ